MIQRWHIAVFKAKTSLQQLPIVLTVFLSNYSIFVWQESNKSQLKGICFTDSVPTWIDVKGSRDNSLIKLICYCVWLSKKENVLPNIQLKAIIMSAFLWVALAGYVRGCIIAQNRSMVTAIRENMELVHNSNRREFIKMQAWKFSGFPTLTARAHGIPRRPENTLIH